MTCYQITDNTDGLIVVSIIVCFKGIRDHKFESGLYDKTFMFTHLLFPHLTQTCQRGKRPNHNQKFYNFPRDNNSVKQSIHILNGVWRVGESQFVSHIKTHKPASSVSRWLGQVLAMPGIENRKFRGKKLSSSFNYKRMT